MTKKPIVTGQGPLFKSWTRQWRRWGDKLVIWPIAGLNWKGR